MTKTYCQKENVYLWYFILVLAIVVLIFGYTVNYLAWQVIPMCVMAGGKIYNLSKIPELPAIELNEKGMVLQTSPESPSYSYGDISSIHIELKFFMVT